jgi:hypothetical protein
MNQKVILAIIGIALIGIIFGWWGFAPATITNTETIIIQETTPADETPADEPLVYEPTCEDSDGGRDLFTAGYVVVDGTTTVYDECVGTLLTEFYCDGNNVVEERNNACPLGYYCEQTRSGGRCI